MEVNQKLLEYMEQTTVGTAFKYLGPFLKLYSMYANNYGQASATLQVTVFSVLEYHPNHCLHRLIYNDI